MNKEAKKGLRDLAESLSFYYDSLKDEGFNEEQATQLTLNLQDRMLGNSAIQSTANQQTDKLLTMFGQAPQRHN